MVEECFDVGTWRLVIERPPSAEELIDDVAFSRDEFLPYWAEVWPSALALSEHIASADLRGLRVLELGCGLGLPSIVAARAGADVVATDWSADALAFARRNAERNGARLTTALLRWDQAGTLDVHGRVFDLVLAADVLYEERNVEPLLAILARIPSADGFALVADPGRRHAALFVAGAERDGWTIATLSSPSLPRGGIHRLWRS